MQGKTLLEKVLLGSVMYVVLLGSVSIYYSLFSVWRDSYVYTLRNEKFHRVRCDLTP